MSIQAGSRCPAALLRSLQSSQNLFESITIVRPLQCTATCSVALCAADSGLCVVKSYQKYKLDDAELQQVSHRLVLPVQGPRSRGWLLLLDVHTHPDCLRVHQLRTPTYRGQGHLDRYLHHDSSNPWQPCSLWGT